MHHSLVLLHALRSRSESRALLIGAGLATTRARKLAAMVNTVNRMVLVVGVFYCSDHLGDECQHWSWRWARRGELVLTSYWITLVGWTLAILMPDFYSLEGFVKMPEKDLWILSWSEANKYKKEGAEWSPLRRVIHMIICEVHFFSVRKVRTVRSLR